MNSGDLREDNNFNSGEALFSIHLHSTRTLAIRGEEEVKLANLVSGDGGMTTVVMLGGGHNLITDVCLIIFENLSHFFPIWNLNVYVPGVKYRTSAKAIEDTGLFSEWLNKQLNSSRYCKVAT